MHRGYALCKYISMWFFYFRHFLESSFSEKKFCYCNQLFCIFCTAYFLSISKRQTIIRSNRQYLVEHLEPSSNLIRRLEQDGCLTSEEANYIESLQRKTAKNHELLTVAKSMSLEKHIAFVESLHFCGQLKVANVLERGGGEDSYLLLSLTHCCKNVSYSLMHCLWS